MQQTDKQTDGLLMLQTSLSNLRAAEEALVHMQTLSTSTYTISVGWLVRVRVRVDIFYKEGAKIVYII